MLLRLAVFFLVTAAFAQQTSWDAVKSVTTGTKIEVRFKDRNRLTGRVEAVTPDGLTLRQGKKTAPVNRAEVTRVDTVGEGGRGKSALIGLGIGFGIGCAIGVPMAGQIADMNHPGSSEKGASCVVFGGLLGGIGALVGGFNPMASHETVYKVSPR
jgi:hypothetical protein